MNKKSKAKKNKDKKEFDAVLGGTIAVLILVVALTFLPIYTVDIRVSSDEENTYVELENYNFWQKTFAGF